MKGKLAGAVLALALLCVPASAVNTTLTIDAPETLPAVGKTFTVEVRVTDNPGLSAAQFTLAFDGGVVACEDARVGAALKGTLSAVNPNAAEGAILAAASVEPVTEDGVLGTFTFRVLSAGSAGFALRDGVFSNEEGNEVPVTVTGGKTQPPTGNSEDTKQPENTGQPESPKQPEETKKPQTPSIPETPSISETAGAAKPAFSDVPADFWSRAQIERAAELGLVSGYADGSFRPNASVTRGQFVTMLWRLAGRPSASVEVHFTDIAGLNAEFREAIAWAAEQGIVNGVTATEFRSGAAINRQQAMTILFRYHGGISGMELALTSLYDAQFKDSGTIAPSLKSGVYWAVYNGIISGVTTDTLAPRGTATRAQIAVILTRYAERLA